MKPTCVLALALLAAPAWATTAADLAKASGCLSCHAGAEKLVGPSFVAISQRYQGDPQAVASLSQSIRNGSKGKWGRAPMPGHDLNPQELKTLSEWVLQFKP